MPVEIEDQLRVLGVVLDEMAPPVTIQEVADSPVVLERLGTDSQAVAVETAPLARNVSERRRAWSIVAAVAAVAVALVGVAVVRQQSDTTNDTPASPGGPANADLFVYPSGGIDGAAEAGFTNARALVRAYLADRTNPSRLPPNYEMRARVIDVSPVDADTTIVNISLATSEDTGDGVVAVQQIPTDSGPVLVVTAAAVFTDELVDVEMSGGRLSGRISSHAGGYTYLYAYDPSTGDLIDSTVISLPVILDSEVQSPETNFELDTGMATAVNLRYWNPVDPVNAYAFANLAEVPVSEGTSGLGAGWAELQRPRPPANTPAPQPTDTASTPTEPPRSTRPAASTNTAANPASAPRTITFDPDAAVATPTLLAPAAPPAGMTLQEGGSTTWGGGGYEVDVWNPDLSEWAWIRWHRNDPSVSDPCVQSMPSADGTSTETRIPQQDRAIDQFLNDPGTADRRIINWCSPSTGIVFDVEGKGIGIESFAALASSVVLAPDGDGITLDVPGGYDVGWEPVERKAAKLIYGDGERTFEVTVYTASPGVLERLLFHERGTDVDINGRHGVVFEERGLVFQYDRKTFVIVWGQGMSGDELVELARTLGPADPAMAPPVSDNCDALGLCG